MGCCLLLRSGASRAAWRSLWECGCGLASAVALSQDLLSVHALGSASGPAFGPVLVPSAAVGSASLNLTSHSPVLGPLTPAEEGLMSALAATLVSHCYELAGRGGILQPALAALHRLAEYWPALLGRHVGDLAQLISLTGD